MQVIIIKQAGKIICTLPLGMNCLRGEGKTVSDNFAMKIDICQSDGPVAEYNEQAYDTNTSIVKDEKN